MARIAFVQNIWMEYLGILYLTALLKSKGHNVEIFIDTNCGRLADAVAEYGPDIVGFSCTTGVHEAALEAARAIKSRMNTLTVFGGPHPTFFPEIIEESGVDVVCIGEGEGALSDLASAVDRKADICAIPNLWVKINGRISKNEVRPLVADLDSLPFPDRSVYYKKYTFLDRSQKMFIAGRGCPYKCSFCFNNSFQKLYEGKGKYVRLRSVDNVIAEIEMANRLHRIKTVYIADDTFIVNRPWLFEFLDKYRKNIRIPFICLVRADLIDEEVVGRLKEANCYSVFFGIESGDENLRKLVLNKNISDEQIIAAAALLKKYGIRFRTYNMLGLPGETIKEAFKTVELNIKIKTDYPWCSILQPYPKTAIRDYALKIGALEDEEGTRFSRSFFKKSVLKSQDTKRCANLQKLFYWAVKLPFIMPLVRKLIDLPPNPVFDALFLAGYANSYYRSERLSFLEVLQVGLRNVKGLLD